MSDHTKLIIVSCACPFFLVFGYFVGLWEGTVWTVKEMTRRAGSEERK